MLNNVLWRTQAGYYSIIKKKKLGFLPQQNIIGRALRDN